MSAKNNGTIYEKRLVICTYDESMYKTTYYIDESMYKTTYYIALYCNAVKEVAEEGNDQEAS